MKAASINEIKQELQSLPPKKVLEVCLRLARYKKENKELLSYLLFEADNEQGFIESVKLEMDGQFDLLPRNNWYAAKKGLRKMLRGLTKYIKHIATKEAELDILLYFCNSLYKSGIEIDRYKALTALYEGQIKKVSKLVKEVHEDLQFDYQRQVDKICNSSQKWRASKTG